MRNDWKNQNAVLTLMRGELAFTPFELFLMMEDGLYEF